MSRPKMYLAGPEVFFPDPLAAAGRKKELCLKYGFEGVFPLDNEIRPDAQSKPEQGFRISRANETLIRASDCLVANMTPFRGPSLDAGTAFELGFARALRKPVFGYTNDHRTYRERVLAVCGPGASGESGRSRPYGRRGF